MKKKSILLLLPFAAMALAGCGPTPTPPPSDPCESAVVQLNKTTLSLEVGASETLVASISVEGCDLGEVTWSSDHPEIAKVENGKVTALAVGTAKITANGAECVVTVTAQPGPVVKHVEDIRIEPNLYPKMKVGDPDYQIDFTVLPEDAENKAVTFSCDTPAVATVSDAGVIHAVAAGKAKITITSVDNSEVSKVLNLTVTAADIVVPSVTSDEYTKVVSGELTNGSQVEFIAQTNGKVYGMKKYDSGNNIKAAECAVGEESIIIDEAVEHYFVEKNDDNTYSFKDSAGNYIYAAGGTSSNHLKAKAEKGDTSKFNVTIADGVASIICAAETTTRNVLALNYNSGTPLFSCYAALGSYSPITLYEKVPEPAKLVSITADMDKKSYTEGEQLDLTGLVVTGHYSDESEAEITEGYSLSMSAGDVLATTDTSLDVTYGDFNCSIPLTVREASITLDSISLSGVKTTYYEGELLGEVVVTAHYSDESSDVVTAELKIGDAVVDGTHVMALEENKLVASYEGKTAEAEFTVLEDVIESIAVSAEHRTFNVGAEFVNETVTATYSSGKTEDVTESSDFTGYDMETAGEQDVTVTFGELEPISYKITVNEVAPIIQPGTYYIKSGGKYLVANADSSKQPLAVDNADDATPFDFLLEKGTDNQYKLKVHGEDKYLYVTASNNGVRIGSTDMVWTIGEGTAIVGEEPVVGGYNLAGVDSKGESRVLTLYEGGPDFRCYVLDEKGQAGNRKDNTFVEKYIEKTLDSIAVTSQPTKNSYFVGDAFDPDGLVVKAHYVWEGDGSEDVEITDYTLSVDAPFTAEDIGTKTITVSYQGKTTTFDVTVEARVATLTSISIDGDPETTTYNEGEAYSAAGLTVTAHYSDDSTSDITASVTITIDKATAALGDTSITYSVEYESLKASKDVDVVVNEVIRATLPHTASFAFASGSAVVTEGWTGTGEAYYTTAYSFKAVNEYVQALKLFDPVSSIKVSVKSIVNSGTADTGRVTIYALNDEGTVVSSDVIAPDHASVSNVNDALAAATVKSVTLSGTDITGVKVEYTTKSSNLALFNVEVRDANAPVVVENVSLDETTLSMEKGGEDVQLVATTSPAEAVAKSTVWSSDHPEIATVTDGLVHAVSAGTANITVTVDGKTATCVVTVSEPLPETASVAAIDCTKTISDSNVSMNKTSAKSGYYQDSGTADTDIVSFTYKSSTALWTSTPEATVFKAVIGGGSAKEKMTYPVEVVLLDADGNEINGTKATITQTVKTAGGDEYTIVLANVENVYGFKVSHMKENSWNARYFSFDLQIAEAK